MSRVANTLLPLGEKVGPKGSDEGALSASLTAGAGLYPVAPSSVSLREPPSPPRGEGALS
jgi:hypothetical protein